MFLEDAQRSFGQAAAQLGPADLAIGVWILQVQRQRAFQASAHARVRDEDVHAQPDSDPADCGNLVRILGAAGGLVFDVEPFDDVTFVAGAPPLAQTGRVVAEHRVRAQTHFATYRYF